MILLSVKEESYVHHDMIISPQPWWALLGVRPGVFPPWDSFMNPDAGPITSVGVAVGQAPHFAWGV